MALWVSELLQDPSLGLQLVAGHEGIDTRGPVRWVHISDTPDPTPWLEGGEVLLTTGLGVRESAALQERLVANLSERGVVALGFGTGVTLDTAPPAMVAACDSHRLPLITVPYEVPFIAVTRRISHHLYEEHYATLRRAVALHREVLTAVVSGKGVDGVLDTVGKAMHDTALVAFDYAGRELGRYDAHGTVEDLGTNRIWQVCLGANRLADTDTDSLVVSSGAVRLGDEVEAFIAAVSHGRPPEPEQLLFEQGIAGVTLELSRSRSIRAARRARVTELLEEAAAGRLTEDLVERSLRTLEANLQNPFRVIAVRRSRSADERLNTVVEDALLPFGSPLTGHLDGVLYAIVGDEAEVAHRIVQAARTRGWTDVRVGRSRAKHDSAALRSALREAHVALTFDGPNAVQEIGQLGISGLLAGLGENLGVGDFVQQVLGPILVHEEGEGAPLLATLGAYFKHGCRPGPAAEELHVHRHTLTYRLERVRDLTGRDPRMGDHLLEFGLALELYSQLNSFERRARSSGIEP